MPKRATKGDSSAETKRLKTLANALDTIQYFTGEPIYFVDFNGHPELGDQQVHEELASYLSDKNEFYFVRYDANPLRVLQRMATFKLAISMRLHASIFAFLAQTPFLSLNYHRKCNQWCEQIGLRPEQAFDTEKFDPYELVNAACIGLSDGFVLPQLSVRDALHRSMKNWRMSYEQANESFVQRSYSAV